MQKVQVLDSSTLGACHVSDESALRLDNPWVHKVMRTMLSNRYKQLNVVVNVSIPPVSWCGGVSAEMATMAPCTSCPPKTTMNVRTWKVHGDAQGEADLLDGRPPGTHFLQDGAPCHKSKKMIAKKEENITSLPLLI